MFIYTDNDIKSHRTLKIYNTKHTNNTKTYFHNYIFLFSKMNICNKNIYLRELTGTKKDVDDNYVLPLITFLIQPFTNQLTSAARTRAHL